MDLDLVVDLLIAYAVGERARAGLQVGELTGRALDAVATKVGDVVVAEFGKDVAIDRLIREARSGGAPSAATRIAARAALDARRCERIYRSGRRWHSPSPDCPGT